MTTPSGRNAGCSEASFSADVSRRGASSTAKSTAAPAARDLHRHDLVLEPAVVARRDRAPVRLERVGVERLAREVPLGRERLGGDPLRHDLPALVQLVGEVAAVRAHRHARHHLDARRDDDVELARPDRGGGVEVRLHRRAALAVDGRPADRLRPARDHRRHPADVPALLADLRHAAHLHVLDLGRIEVVARDEAVQHLRRELVAARAGERAVPPADRAANGVDDVGLAARHSSNVAVANAPATCLAVQAQALGSDSRCARSPSPRSSPQPDSPPLPQAPRRSSSGSPTAAQPVHVAAAPGDATGLYIVEKAGRVLVLRGRASCSRSRSCSCPASSRTARAACSRSRSLRTTRPPGSFYTYSSSADLHIEIAEYRRSAADPGRADPASRRRAAAHPASRPDEPLGRPAAVRPRRLPLRGDGGRRRRQRPGRERREPRQPARQAAPHRPAGRSALRDRRPATRSSASAGARPEIWAFGLRNPWRFSFDRATGDLALADVGQGAWEEVDFAPRGTGAGAFYGWDAFEGTVRVTSEPLPAADARAAGAGAAALGGGLLDHGRLRRPGARSALARRPLRACRLLRRRRAVSRAPAGLGAGRRAGRPHGRQPVELRRGPRRLHLRRLAPGRRLPPHREPGPRRALSRPPRRRRRRSSLGPRAGSDPDPAPPAPDPTPDPDAGPCAGLRKRHDAARDDDRARPGCPDNEPARDDRRDGVGAGALRVQPRRRRVRRLHDFRSRRRRSRRARTASPSAPSTQPAMSSSQPASWAWRVDLDPLRRWDLEVLLGRLAQAVRLGRRIVARLEPHAPGRISAQLRTGRGACSPPTPPAPRRPPHRARPTAHAPTARHHGDASAGVLAHAPSRPLGWTLA